MDDGSRDDNTGAELAHGNNDSTIHAHGSEPLSDDRGKYTDGAGNKNDEKQADAQGYIVVMVRRLAAHVDRVAVGVYTVPGNSQQCSSTCMQRETYSTPAWAWQSTASPELVVSL